MGLNNHLTMLSITVLYVLFCEINLSLHFYESPPQQRASDALSASSNVSFPFSIPFRASSTVPCVRFSSTRLSINLLQSQMSSVRLGNIVQSCEWYVWRCVSDTDELGKAQARKFGWQHISEVDVFPQEASYVVYGAIFLNWCHEGPAKWWWEYRSWS